jgi:hypothetical protein
MANTCVFHSLSIFLLMSMSMSMSAEYAPVAIQIRCESS